MVINVHFITPVVEECRNELSLVLGDPQEITIDRRARRGQSNSLLVWTVDDDVARENGLLMLTVNRFNRSREFNDWLKKLPPRSPLWPLVGFTLDRQFEFVPANFDRPNYHDVVYTGDALWFHFVEHTGNVNTVSYQQVSKHSGLWGAEEGYVEAGSHCEGWFVTAEPKFQHVPKNLHSVFG